MESFVILAFSIAVFLQFLPLQLCKEIQSLEAMNKHNESVLYPDIDIKFGKKQNIEVGKDAGIISLPLNRIESTDSNCIENFCENVPDYPMEMINNAAKDIPSTAFNGVQGKTMEIGNKQSSEESTGLCDTRVRVIFPQRARNIYNKNVFIVNHEEKVQRISLSVCRNTNMECRKAIFPLTHTSKCKQMYSEVHLLAYDEESPDKLVDETFKMPICCACSVERTNNIQ